MYADTRGYTPNPEGPFPPLPDPLPPFPEPPFPRPIPEIPRLPELPERFPPRDPVIRLRQLLCGCYLINYRPSNTRLLSYDGTLRVECLEGGRRASGDLYNRPLLPIPLPPRPGAPWVPQFPGFPPNPANGIPVFSRARYRYYLRVTKILEHFTFGNSFTLAFTMYKFDHTTRQWDSGTKLQGAMRWVTAPPGYPSSVNYLEGDMENESGGVVGRLTMGWISKYLRKATIEIDRVTQSEAPLDNGAGLDWRGVGDSMLWELTVDNSNANIIEPSGESWSNAECHEAMLNNRAQTNLDREWRYHILCVRRLDETERGIMYDNGASDSNNVPREGCAISSHWVVPNTAAWGRIQGQRFGTATGPYFRTAVHETGHAMLLYHNTIDMGYMNTTNVIAAGAVPPQQFPDNVQWGFAQDDLWRLRHMPDNYVRPGGVPFGTNYPTSIMPTDDERVVETGIRLTVEPLMTSVPLGAPVRIGLRLRNESTAPLTVPPSLSLGRGYVRGWVTDPSGTVRSFSPLVLCLDEDSHGVLDADKELSDSLTLLRGGQGPLFPSPGLHTVAIEARWEVGGLEHVATGSAQLMVSSAVDDQHNQAALAVLSSPDLLLTMVLGGDHMAEGQAALRSALDNPILRPHFAHLEAKRLMQRFGKRKSDFEEAAKLISGESVMSLTEVKRAAQLIQNAAKDSAPRKRMGQTLRAKASGVELPGDVKAVLDAV